ncbi:hypothetical protein [Corynebacterium urogenitale]
MESNVAPLTAAGPLIEKDPVVLGAGPSFVGAGGCGEGGASGLALWILASATGFVVEAAAGEDEESAAADCSA